MKNILIFLIKKILHLFYIFPINQKRVLFSSYSGKNYSCNPKYITEELLKEKNENIQIIWAFAHPEKENDLNKRIKKVKFKSLQYIFYLLTAKVVVDNVESWSILPKRKNQIVINTWHGGGAYKGVGLKRKDTNNSQNRNMLNKHERVTLYVSSSKAFTELTLRGSFQYFGKVIECGMPRNDKLINYNKSDRVSLLKKIGLDENKRIKYVLFAPTYRKDLNYRQMISFEKVLEALTERFSGEWKLLYRCHYYQNGKGNIFNESIINVSDYPDMQDILLVSDAFITDYSSSMWDYSLLNRPGFLFTPDIEKYTNEERELYTPIETWPFKNANTIEELLNNIRFYDFNIEFERIKKHHDSLEIYETGKASQILCNYIKKHLS